MYRLMIVDDEPIIADGLFELFEEETELELDLCKAYSGAEALELMQKARIDIVLSDICMPDINGLDLQREIRRQWPGSQFVFLTGFNDFVSIQKAMRSESVDFILKTEGDEVIIRAVRNAAASIDREVRNRHTLRQARESKHMYLSMLGGRFFQEIIKGAPCPQDELKRQLTELEIPLSADSPVLMLLGRTSARPFETGFAARMKKLHAIQNLGKAQLSMSASVFSLDLENGDILWLTQPGVAPAEGSEVNDWRRLALFTHGCMDSIQYACGQILGITLSLAAAGRQVSWEMIGPKFDRLKSALIKSESLGGEALIIDDPDDEDESLQPPNVHGDLSEDIVRRHIKKAPTLKTLLESGRKEDFQVLLSDLTDSMCHINSIPESLFRELYFSISLLLLAFINENKLTYVISRDYNLESLTRLEAHASRCDAIDNLKLLANRIFSNRMDESRHDATRILEFVRNYVHDHITGELSLTKMSELLHFNPSYFSRLFKSIGGSGYAEFVAKERIAKACDLLRSGCDSVNELSDLLGFNSPSNFSRFFKKHMNLSPQDYRDMIRKK